MVDEIIVVDEANATYNVFVQAAFNDRWWWQCRSTWLWHESVLHRYQVRSTWVAGTLTMQQPLTSTAVIWCIVASVKWTITGRIRSEPTQIMTTRQIRKRVLLASFVHAVIGFTFHRFICWILFLFLVSNHQCMHTQISKYERKPIMLRILSQGNFADACPYEEDVQWPVPCG